MLSIAIRRHARLWIYLARRSLMTQVTYRGDFFLGLARNVATVALILAFYSVLFLRTTSIAGWNLPALLVLYGSFRLVRGALYFFAEDTITAIPEAVRRGELDFILVKPVNARFLLTCAQINLGAALNAAIGLGLVVYGVRTGHTAITAGAVAGYTALIGCAVITFYNLLFMVMTLSFWVVKVDGLQYLFEELMNMAGLPSGAYQGAIRVLFTYLLPLGVAATIPAGVLTGHATPGFYLYAPICAVVSSLASVWLWRRALSAYTSAGG